MGKEATIPAKVLVIDDEPNIVTAVEFLLQQQNLEVAKAYNGVEALEILPEFNPDIIILDVMMPGIDGFEVARKIRSMSAFENIRIVFLTAKGTDKDRWAGYASGGEVYLTKPFDNETLIEVVMEILKFG